MSCGAMIAAMMVGLLSCSTSASPPTSSGLHSTPGRTACGTRADCASYPEMPTDSDGQPFCCIDPSLQPTCHPGYIAACESGVPFYCDEAADCAPGLHCCNDGSRTMFVCKPSCGGELQLCKTDAECENGQPCTPYLCSSYPKATCDPYYLCIVQPLATCGALAFNPGFGSSFGCVAAP